MNEQAREQSERDKPKPTISVEEIINLSGLGRGAVYEGFRRGDLPGLRIGRRIIFSRAAIMRLLENGKRV